MKRRRQNYTEPVRCVCEPGSEAHPAHGKPGAKAADHTDPRCRHSTLRDTTRPAPKATKRRSLRIDLNGP
jgi:hypothetical protein